LPGHAARRGEAVGGAVAGPAEHRVALLLAGNGIVPALAEQTVRAVWVAVEPVAAEERVVVGAPEDGVVPRPADDQVISGSALERVIAVAPEKGVIRVIPLNRVVTPVPEQEVILGAAVDEVVAVATGERV